MPGGFLERIQGRGTEIDPVASIVDHLIRMLNTRRGAAPSAPSYGVLDFTEIVHLGEGGPLAMAKAIRATIQEHEPRLKNVNVRAMPRDGDLRLLFEISAQLAEPGTQRALRLSATVRPGSRVEVAR